MLTFGRSRRTLLTAICALTPFGESLLSFGIYTVALKKLTSAANRSLAFGVQYVVYNLAGALTDLADDALRAQDFGAGWSGLRVHVLTTWVAVLASLVLCVC